MVADYITRAGGNAIFNYLRDSGPAYADVLADVCNVMDVKVPKGMSSLAMEDQLLRDVMRRVWEGITPAQREEFGRAAEAQMRATGQKFDDVPGNRSWMFPFSALVAAIVMGAMVGAAASRGAALMLGPIGWLISAVWTAVDVVGPSYRGLAPAVFQVAALRQTFLWAEDEEEQAA